MCTVLLPPGDNTIAVNKYLISYHKAKERLALRGDRTKNYKQLATIIGWNIEMANNY